MDIPTILKPSVFKKSKVGKEQIASIEAYYLFKTLQARYTSIETYQFYTNLIHDRDFSILLNQHLADFQNQVKTLEKLARKHKVKVPPKPPKKLQFSAQIDVITDKHIFKQAYNDLIAELFSLVSSFVVSTLNDNLREEFMKFTLSHLNNFEQLYKYGKLKGWIDAAPSFKTNKPVEKESLSVSEATHIWDHINLRYEHVQITQFFIDFVHDEDFRLLLLGGSNTLMEQVKLLEDKAIEYEVPLPERPPETMEAAIDPEIMEDKFVYSLLFKSLQQALNMHVRAVLDSVRNDPLRQIFFDFLKAEMKLFDNLLRYGKMKGWTQITPKYRKG